LRRLNISPALLIATGAFAGQASYVVVMPMLGVLYEPAAFADLLSCTQLITVLSSLATLKLDLALGIIRSGRTSCSLRLLCFVAPPFVVGISIAAVYTLSVMINWNHMTKIVLETGTWIVAGAWLTAVTASETSWCLRNALFGRVAISRFFRGSVNSTMALIGSSYFGSPGLLIAVVAGCACGLVGVMDIKTIQRNDFSLLKWRAIANKYKQFPLHVAPSAFFDSLAIGIPVFTGSYFLRGEELGQYTILVTLIGAPTAVISSAFAQTLYAATSKAIRDGICPLPKLKSYARIASMLSIIATVVAVSFDLSILPDWVIRKWPIAVDIFPSIIAIYASRFVLSPISYATGLAPKQKVCAAWKYGYFIFSFLSSTAGAWFGIYFFVIAILLSEIISNAAFILVFKKAWAIKPT